MHLARLFDTYGSAETLGFAPDRPRTDDRSERERLAGFLAGGGYVFATTGRYPDVLDPGRGEVVPMSVHTDGTWVWSAAHGYYALEHGILPEPQFLEHIRATGYRAAIPTADQIAEALQAVQAAQAPPAQ